MLYWKIRWMEFKKAYWKKRSKWLFMKYGNLEQFTYHGILDLDGGFFGEDYIEVGTEDVKHYFVADSREGYKDLKYMLNLELKIRYNNTDS